MEFRNESKIAHMFVVGIILGAALLYFPPYAWAWVGDDYVQFDYVLKFLKRPLSAIQLFNPHYLPWYYRPTQNLWFLGNRTLFGLNPVPFYWQMVLWHSLATALVYRILRQFGVMAYFAVLATALFAIHGHYVDVVGWNSSVAIVMAAVFSLMSLNAYACFLTTKNTKKVKKNKYLIWVFIFFFLALLTHEEAILLPLFFVMLTVVNNSKQKARGEKTWYSKAQGLALGGMLLLTAVSIFMQFNRPNLTIDISQTPATQWWGLVSPLHIGQFVKDISLHYTLTMTWDLAQNAAPLILAILILLLFGAWFLLGNWPVRLGLIWLILHLGLIYATLWQAKPQLLAGRHFYQASIGLILAIGASIDQLREIKSPKVRIRHGRVSWMMMGIVAVITVILTNYILAIQSTQQEWLDRAKIDQSARLQMQAILPELTDDTRVFANKFPITPAFFRAVTAIWYERDTAIPRPSGSFAQLQAHGHATHDYYVFNYEDGTLYNLMPELQAADKTVFLWSQGARLDVIDVNGHIVESETTNGAFGFAVIGGDKNGRFAVKLAPTAVVAGWLSLAYVMPEIPTDSALHLSMRTDDASGASARIRLETGQQESIILFEEQVTGEWTDFTAPIGEFTDEHIIIRLETTVAPGGTVYWANPRFVTGK